MTIPGSSPLNYPINTQPAIQRIRRSRSPTTNDSKNVREGDEWLDESTTSWYKLADVTGTTATWVRIGGVPGDLQTITTPDTTVVVPTDGNINFLNGTGVNITGSGSDITFTTISWSVETDPTASLSVNTGVFANNAGGVTFTLPVNFSVGDTIEVYGINAGGWTIAQNASQNIQFGNQTTTTGVAGSLVSTVIGDGVCLVCSVADTTFVVTHSMGNITVN